jgi:DNA repair protein RadC
MNTNVITSQAHTAPAAEAKAGLSNGQVGEAIRSEDAAPAYESSHETGAEAQDNGIIAEALAIIDRHWKAGKALTSPRDSAAFLKLKLGAYQWEVFGVLFLDNRHRVLAFEEMFRGTLDGASVHPREVVRAALNHNAAAVIFAHNHPSGVSEPSAADRNITRQLRDALQLIGVCVLDQLVIGAGEPTSMAARGLI